MPYNAVSDRRYSGVNIPTLWDAVASRGFSCHAFLTFRQAIALGGSARKGERGIGVIYTRLARRRASAMTGLRFTLGHNGGPPLDDEDNGPPVPRYRKYYRHWSPPSDGDVRAYDAFRVGTSRPRVRRPSGSCARVLMQHGKPLAFSATVDTFGCRNFSANPPAPITLRRGFVTIYEGDRVVWKGHQEDLPDTYR